MKKVFRQKIIDAHHHFWNYDSNKYTWLKASKNKKFHRSYLPEDLLNDSGDLRLIKTK